MRFYTGSVLLALAALSAMQGCAGVTDPVKPNSPPRIYDCSPEDLLLAITVPDDSIIFSFRAVDPDGDKLTCSFVLADDRGDVLDVLCNEPDYVFRPEEGGFYHIEGRAYDHSSHTARDWFVSAVEQQNDPPVIVSFTPDQDSIAVLEGSMLEFTLVVEDDHPGDLRYSFYLGSEPIEVMSEVPLAEYRFMDNGFFDVAGMVWDGEFGDTLTWVVWVRGEPDTIAPAGISDLTGRVGADPGTIRLRWTAVGDDGMEGNAYRYLIRTSDRYIVDYLVWRDASQVESVPVPGPPGTVEEMIARELEPAAWIYVSVRAVDYYGNVSELGNCIRVLSGGDGVVEGFITDAASGAPVGGIEVSAGTNLCISSADGYYMLSEAESSGDTVMFRDGDGEGGGDYFDAALPVFGAAWRYGYDIAMMPYFDLVSVLAGSYNGSFYTFFRYMTYTTGLLGRPTIFRNWNHFPVTIYNPPYSWEGVDIQESARTAINSWNDLTWKDLFVETSDSASADVKIVYDTGTDEVKHHVETVSLNEDGTPAEKLICIYPNHQIAPIQYRGRRIFAHELGHVLQLAHSTDLGHLMVGGTSPIRDDPSEDEINLVRSLYGLPVIFDAKWYLER